MPGLIVWKNKQMDKMRRDMDRLCIRVYDEFGIPLFPKTARKVPSLNLSETEDTLVIRAELADIKPEDLDISVTDDTLRIKGETRQTRVEERGDYHRMRRRYGSFSRTLQLPCRINIDDVKATYKKGVLNIVLSKYRPEKAREIKIKVT